jgi:hypothetical protein
MKRFKYVGILARSDNSGDDDDDDDDFHMLLEGNGIKLT